MQFKSLSFSDQSLIKLIQESELLISIKDQNEYQKRLNKTLAHLKTIMKSKKLVNVFRLENEQDIEMTILRAFLNSKDFI